MRAIFSARRSRRAPPRSEPKLLSGACDAPCATHAQLSSALRAQPQASGQLQPAMSSTLPTNDPVLDEMLGKLDDFLSPLLQPGPPPPQPPPPQPSLSLVSVTERAVGIGNLRGTGMVGPFNVRSLKGVQLDAVVRFQYWAETPEESDALVTGLQGRLRSAGNELRAAGFLRIEAAGITVAESVAAVNDFWRKSADYRVLYEFQYEDNDDALGLIAKIPVDVAGFFANPMEITDDMVRWDDVAAPALAVRGSGTRPRRLSALTAVAFLPDTPAIWDGLGVTVRVSVGGVEDEQNFASVRSFLDAFDELEGTIVLNGNSYFAGRLPLEAVGFPVALPFILKGDDFLTVSYSDEKFDGDAIFYLRVL
ncbi:MAG: hypothetical protein LC803_19025 [Acidobacteria bacterium]|nr:hypothetical protein [Acidobacteriota bacterium]